MAENEQTQEIIPASVETQAEATPATETVVEETPAADAAAPPTEDHKVPAGVQKRIDQLTREKYEAKREADYLRQLAMQQAQPQQQVPQPQGKPTREQFNYDEDAYLEALTDYKAREVIARQQYEQQAYQHQVRQQQQRADYSQRVENVNITGSSKYADYEDVVVNNHTLPISPVMADAISLTDVSADIAYHLGKNQQEAARIYQLPPPVQIMEIARLEQKLKAPAPKKTTNAPAPIEPVGARGQVITDPEKLSTAEWIRRRNAGEIK